MRTSGERVERQAWVMAKNTDRFGATKKTGARQEKSKIYVDELYFRHVDQVERWRRECEHYQTVENKLLEFSQFSYEEFDYEPLMVRAIFTERAIPDYSYLLKDALLAAENKFYIPMAIRIILLVIFLIILIAGTNSILLWMSGVGVLTLLIAVFLIIQERQGFIAKTLIDTQAEIDRRIANEKQKIADEKQQHEELEEQRIKIIEDLLAGEISSIFSKIENVLGKFKYFIPVSAEIDLYNNIPSIKVWLPPKTVIPVAICALQASGRSTFTDKEVRVINKQYLELCAGILMQIVSVIYAHIPTFRTGYIYGMSKEGLNTECLIGSKIERETLISACDAATGLEALQILKSDFRCNTSLALLPTESKEPEEWDGVEQKSVRRLHVQLFNS